MDPFLISKLFLIPEPPLAPEAIQKAYRGLAPSLQGSRVPWQFACPDKAYRAITGHVQDYHREVASLDTSYLQKVWEPTSWVFDQLRPAKINLGAFERFSELDKTGHTGTFKPDSDGFARVVEYDRVTTVTGRLHTVAGPALLHLPKIYRGLLESRWKDEGGLVVALDYKCLEPRVARVARELLCGGLPEEGSKGCNPDIYSDFNSDLPREVVKKAVISQLYGIGLDALNQQLLPFGLSQSEIEDLISSAREFFGLDLLQEKLKIEWETSNRRFITNFYGRRIATETRHTLVNHYIQSTAADISFLGFTNVIRYLEEQGRLHDTVFPLFFNHDAVVLDCHPNSLNGLFALAKVGSVEIEGFPETRFFMAIDKNFTIPNHK